MNGSVITPMNWPIASNVVCWVPVATSPEAWVSAKDNCCGVKLNKFWKPAGSVAPVLMNLSIAAATLVGLIGALGGSSGERKNDDLKKIRLTSSTTTASVPEVDVAENRTF